MSAAPDRLAEIVETLRDRAADIESYRDEEDDRLKSDLIEAADAVAECRAALLCYAKFDDVIACLSDARREDYQALQAVLSSSPAESWERAKTLAAKGDGIGAAEAMIDALEASSRERRRRVSRA